MARKLTIRTKLAAVLAVPLVMLAVFAGFQVNGAHERSDQLKSQAALATTAVGPSGVVDALVTERDFETFRVLGLEKKAAGLGVKNSRTAEDSTDGKVGDFRTNLGALGTGISGSYTPALAVTVAKLNGDHGLRAQVEDLASHAGAANAEKAQVVFNGYTSVIEGLLDADQQATSGIDDGQTRTGVELLNALNRQNDVESQVVIDTAIASLAKDPVLARQVQNVAGMQLRGDDDLRTRAGNANYGRALLPALQAPLRAKAIAQMKAAAADPLHAKIETLLSLPHGSGLLRSAVSNVAGIVAERSTARTVAAQNDQRNWIVLTIVSLLVAIAMLWLTRRWITGPLQELADQAGSMANDRLPNAVNEILETPLEDDVVRPDVAPVLVKAGGEVRAVADALNAVQESALSLAVEQASLRRNVADAYVNLGRRNQNLLSRQLEFISQLENDESDPETLEHLFKLDHLATRMRRNAESLLVLAGNAPPRTWGAPVAVSDVVRGALGEVEGYQRVRLRHLDDGRVDGAAAADVSHVVAELTENALAFSPPDAEVEVYGRRDDYGYVLTIVDSGIGMSAEDLQHANELISAPNELSLAPSRYLGHYVVGQLAARHELTVHLAASPGGGLTAMIVLPAALLGITPPAPTAVVDVDALPPDTLDVTAAERPTLTLPRRESAPDDVPEPAASDLEMEDAPDATVVALPVLALAPEPEPEAEPERESMAPAEPPAPVPHESLDDTQPAPAETAIEEPAPEPVPEPAPPARARIGLGSFADLRGATVPPERPAEPPKPQPAPVPADTAPLAPAPEPAPEPAPDRRVAFAEVAQAVDVATTRADPAGGSAFAEDFLPSRLPKRGRRAKSLQTAWAREKPAAAVTPASVPPAPRPLDQPPAGSTGSPVEGAESPGALRFGPTSPAPAAGNGNGDGNGAARQEAAGQEADGEQRFAFFAAFRAAAERARRGRNR